MIKYIYYFSISSIIIILSFIFIFFNDEKKPKIVYMPDMYYSNAYEPYSDPDFIKSGKCKSINNNIFNYETSSLTPVKNTVSRKKFYDPTSYLISIKGQNFSKKIKTSPLINKNNMNEILKDGKRLYYINCSICHGEKGDGQGFLVKNEKILGIPDYKDRELTVGSVYYVITYGKNNMGSYSSQLNEIDRWKVSEYVMHLKK
ncbi:c-type cytochrome [Blattabacterium cuenoti]|uniref:c-type cytochrome n=1 Tax=Blattabacterium cuenoti TaxID=1653831 RepID=UPI00163BB132|nr:cytochrome c [Blattabacterium cuenoti]